MKHRVVVTGLGAVTPLGTDVESSWEMACHGQSGIATITRFDATDFPSRIAGEVKGFDPTLYIEPKEVKKMDLFIQYALASGLMAVEDAKLKFSEEQACRVGVLVGAGLGGLPAIEKYHALLLEKGYRKISPFFIPMLIANLAAGHISMRTGAKGPNSCVSTACATGTHAIGDGFKIIQRGDADAMICGGTESVITPLAVGGFCNMKALSTRNDSPAQASRPFDAGRDGFVIGEGAGVVVLEELNRALARQARIYVEVVGYGMSGDAYHITAPDPDGSGAARCMQWALDDGGILPTEVSYINAHGTSTQPNDRLETLAVKTVFGEHAYRLAISSTKSVTGHLLGAAGGVEAIFTALTLLHGLIPPTVNYETPDPDCDLDYVPNKARRTNVRIALSNSFGFGGTNATLVFKRFEGNHC